MCLQHSAVLAAAASSFFFLDKATVLRIETEIELLAEVQHRHRLPLWADILYSGQSTSTDAICNSASFVTATATTRPQRPQRSTRPNLKTDAALCPGFERSRGNARNTCNLLAECHRGISQPCSQPVTLIQLVRLTRLSWISHLHLRLIQTSHLTQHNTHTHWTSTAENRNWN